MSDMKRHAWGPAYVQGPKPWRIRYRHPKTGARRWAAFATREQAIRFLTDPTYLAGEEPGPR